MSGGFVSVPSHLQLCAEKKRRLQALADRREWPKEYVKNSPQEAALLEYAEHFRRQHSVLYPTRAAPPLALLNECGVTKFVSSFVRPSQLQFAALYELPNCAQFCAELLRYVPLEDATRFPDALCSPSTLLELGAGDCLDLATFLVALLRGVGFDAYAVAGYAKKWVTLRDLSTQPCPLTQPAPPLPPWLRARKPDAATAAATEDDSKSESRAEEAAGSEAKPGDAAAAKGAASDSAASASDAASGAAATAAAAAAAASATNVAAAAAAATDPTAARPESAAGASAPAGQPLPGEAASQQAAASPQGGAAAASSDGAEATTGAEKDGAGDAEEKKSAASVHAAAKAAEAAPYRLREPASRVSTFLELKKQRDEADAKRREERAAEEKERAQRDPLEGRRAHCWVLVRAGWRGVLSDVMVEPSTGAVYALDDEHPYLRVEGVWNEKNYWVNQQLDAPVDAEMSFDLADELAWESVLLAPESRGAPSAAPAAANKQIDASDKKEAAGEFKDAAASPSLPLGVAAEAPRPNASGASLAVLDCPVSWSRAVRLNAEQYRLRFAGGCRTERFRRCVVEKFAEFDAERFGLVQRVTLFADDECTVAQEVRETYAHRKDKLVSCVRWPLEKKVQETYEAGRSRGLKSYTEVEGERRVFEFFPGARVDGMVRREEVIGVKVIEVYEGRDDFLTYRSVSIDVSGQASAARQKGFVVAVAGLGEVPISKIAEKFARNAALPAELDVRKRTHFIADGQIRLDLHYASQHITASQITYDKASEQCSGYRVDPHWKKPSPAEVKRELHELVQTEKQLLSLVKDRERDNAELLEAMQRDRAAGTLHKTVYDLAQEQAREEPRHVMGRAALAAEDSKPDYLAPFLAQYPPGKPLSRKQAQQIKEDCLKALKERLLERANIIQAHLDTENEKLKQRQAIYSRQGGAAANNAEADEEFSRFYEEATFRISILQARLARHEEISLQKYAQLDRRLREDPRLRALEQK